MDKVETIMAEAESANNGVYFLSLELENVRCFGKKQKLDLSDGNGNYAKWTVILGDNGKGKTTLLQVLAKTRMNKPIENRPVIVENLKLFQQDDSNWLKVDTGSYSIIPSFICQQKLCFPQSNPSYIGFEFEATSVIANARLWCSEHESIERLLDFKCIGYGATRRLNKSSLYKKENTDTTASLFDDKAELIDAEEWILRKDYSASKESPIQMLMKKQLELVKDILTNVLPDIEDIKIFPPNEDEPNPLLYFKNPFGWARLSALSLGYQSMIAWIVDLVVCLFEYYPDSPKPIEEPVVVLIDEIDLHLHPKWQREIMRYLSERFINTQFIVTAHSPLIVQAAEDENANIVVLRREEGSDEVIIDQQPKAIHGWRVDQLLASDLFGLEGVRSPKNEKLLKDRRAILSKGELTEADKIKLEELEEKIGDLPTAETITHIKAMDIIERAAKLLEAEK